MKLIDNESFDYIFSWDLQDRVVGTITSELFFFYQLAIKKTNCFLLFPNSCFQLNSLNKNPNFHSENLNFTVLSKCSH